ncbi:Era-like GTP-binding protein [Methanonatronarchaeum sp. AMET-Sl]|uniref:Era-like GTP-binding protein n=1 Tax=Methanonatronarchaeum sp. AMET-Sl TaxID=3037654 RepID=UPI00244E2CC9|nr:Era-like GTP-binding protein [Methanonatronarchaeum sp. AMET-Sl]WGI17044.1 Era-like GTP-binding protein [Methanonatronarchaeum sp. AMET-Sl]
MGLLDWFYKRSLSRYLKKLFNKENAKIGLYGPPNAGKTTLANKIVRDWSGDVLGPVSEIPHETRKARLEKGIEIKSDGATLNLDILDTPGIATKIDFEDFIQDFELNEGEAKRRAKEATKGVIDAINWLDDIDAILLIMDSTLDPYNQVNVTMIGNMEARKIPFIIVANKIDEEDSDPEKIEEAFPNHPVVPISAIEGENVSSLYDTMINHFG